MSSGADRASRLASRFQGAPTAGSSPKATPPLAPPEPPMVRRTYYLPTELADWLDAEQRRLNYELPGGLPKSRLLKAILEDARPRLEAIVEQLRKGTGNA